MKKRFSGEKRIVVVITWSVLARRALFKYSGNLTLCLLEIRALAFQLRKAKEDNNQAQDGHRAHPVKIDNERTSDHKQP